ncbi:MAG TPA: D-alanine--D-alanine ligase family protein, partial [Thermoleophilaceae bacterium]
MRVAVLAGGRSSEHDVSLSSAESVRAGLAEGGHEPLDVRIDRDGRWTHDGEPIALEPSDGLLDADVVFPVLHGPFGEDGTVQGLLELLDVPYVGAGVMSSSVAMDKAVFKDLMRAHGIPQVDYVAVREGAEVTLPPPVFVKPARLGSSVGIGKAWSEADLDGALAGAFRHDPLVLVERFSDGLEVECSVLGRRDPIASQPGEIVLTNSDWYDYEAKYEPGGMELVVPARVSEEVREEVRRLAVEVFKLVDCSGMARVDFFVEDGDRVLVNELNTIPGFTSTSVYAKLFDASGIPYVELLERLLALALERHEE